MRAGATEDDEQGQFSHISTSRCKLSREYSIGARFGLPHGSGHLAGHIRFNFCHCAVYENWLRIAPPNSFAIKRSHIPEQAFMTATLWLKSGELSGQLLGNQVVLVP